MSDDTTRDADDSPTLAQRLHAATGDRDAEAEELARNAPDEVSAEDAKIAVQRSHGEAADAGPRPAERHPDEELAEPSDAEAVHDERT